MGLFEVVFIIAICMCIYLLKNGGTKKAKEQSSVINSRMAAYERNKRLMEQQAMEAQASALSDAPNIVGNFIKDNNYKQYVDNGLFDSLIYDYVFQDDVRFKKEHNETATNILIKELKRSIDSNKIDRESAINLINDFIKLEIDNKQLNNDLDTLRFNVSVGNGSIDMSEASSHRYRILSGAIPNYDINND